MLGDNIKYLRLQKGFSQEYIAEQLGYKSYTTIQKWESGVAEPPLKKLKELAILLNADINDMTNKDLKWESFQGHSGRHELTSKRLRLAMSNANITAQELSIRSGVSKASISQYVNSSHKPSHISSEKMAPVLNVSPLWLMGFDVPIKESPPSLSEGTAMNVGQFIKKLRNDRGMTLEEFGDKLGVGKSTVRKWETGMIANMRLDKVERIAHVFNVPLTAFFESYSMHNVENNSTVLTLGDIIKKYRDENSLSMDDFSLKSGISKSYISLLEKNRQPKTGKNIAPSIQCIRQAAEGMNMSFYDLFSILDGIPKENSLILSDREKELILNYRCLINEDKKMVERMIAYSAKMQALNLTEDSR